MNPTLSVLIIIPFFFACKSTNYTPKTYTGQQLVVGTSGGVTGMIKEFVLFENGQLFVSKGINGDWKQMKKLKKSKANEIFNKAAVLGLGTLTFKHPGNMTYYLILKNPPRSNEIKWGESGILPPEGVSEFYNYLLSLF